MKKNEFKIKLPIIRVMLGLILILSSMILVTEVNAAGESNKEHLQYITEEMDVKPYRNKTNADGNYTIVPESIEGDEWIFAGWYTDSSCKTSLGEDVKTGTYTAKFVPAHVLDVKAQISSNVYNDNDDDDSAASLRFVTSTDSLKYRKVGFEVVLIEGEEPVTVASNTVYKKLYAVGSTKEVMTYKPSDIFCSMSQYFKACTITGIPEAAFGDVISATSFWITKDGTLVRGTMKSTTVNEGINALKVYVSSNGNDNNAGTKTSPLKTLDKALEQVLSGGTIYVLDSFTADTEFVWEEHSKNVAIKGGTIDFSNISTLNIYDSVTFSSTSLTFADKAKIYAWGNRLKIDSNVTMDTTNCLEIYGGGTTDIASDTELILLAGTYQYIYGGGDNADTVSITPIDFFGNEGAAITKQFTTAEKTADDMLTLTLHSVDNDNTWWFNVNNMELVASQYYKLPVTIDGTEGHVIIGKNSGTGRMVIWSNFFPLCGDAAIPTSSFTVTAGTVMQEVSSSDWKNPIAGGDSVEIGTTITIELVGGVWTVK